jgi:PHAX RNA-binding domain
MPESGMRPSLRSGASTPMDATTMAADSEEILVEVPPAPASTRGELIADAPSMQVVPVVPVRAPPTVAEVDELARSLGDPVAQQSDAWLHYEVVLTELGGDGVRSLVDRARDVDANGGLTVVAGERKRTLGGVFFALAREAVGPETWRALRRTVRQNVKKAPHAPPKPVRPEPEVLVRRRSW